jgi:hypothetical protein
MLLLPIPLLCFAIPYLYKRLPSNTARGNRGGKRANLPHAQALSPPLPTPYPFIGAAQAQPRPSPPHGRGGGAKGRGAGVEESRLAALSPPMVGGGGRQRQRGRPRAQIKPTPYGCCARGRDGRGRAFS